MADTMKAVRNHQLSWEKQTCFDLENGWLATVEFNPHYGSFVARLDNPDRTAYWHCSNGLDKLPDFAKEWRRGGDFYITANLIEPKFEEIYER